MSLGALALAQRALVLDARSQVPCVLRGVLVALMLVAVHFAWATSQRVGAPGLHLFAWQVYVNFAFVTVLGIGTFSRVIAEEKEDQTLGLLKLAGFGSASILVGKSLGQLLAMAMLLVVQVPFALLAITLGGVTSHQIFAAWVILLAHLLLVYGLGLLGSVVAVRTAHAARITAMLLLCYYVLPQVFVKPPQPTIGMLGSGPSWVQAESPARWVADNSALVALSATTTTGFKAPLLSTPVVVTLCAAALLFLAAGMLFGPCSRNEGRALERSWLAPGHGRRAPYPTYRRSTLILAKLRRRRNRGPAAVHAPRLWVARLAGGGRGREDGGAGDGPFFQKDFRHLCGGETVLTLRMGVYAFLTMLGLAGVRHWGRGYDWLIIALLLAATLELVVHANRMFGEEVRSGTLALLLIAPVTLRTIVKAKARACALIAVPPFLCLAAIGLLTPMGSTSCCFPADGLYLLVQLVLGVHVAVYLSLRLRRASLELGILFTLLSVTTVDLFTRSCCAGGGAVGAPANGCYRLPIVCMLIAAMRTLQPVIGAQIRARAAE